MRTLKKLPSHLIGTQQAGGKFADIYPKVLSLGIGHCLAMEAEDTGAETFAQLVGHCHSITQTLHVRKGQEKRFSCRSDKERGVVYIVRRGDQP